MLTNLNTARLACRGALALVLLVGVLLTAGCGGEGDTAPKDVRPSDATEDLRANETSELDVATGDADLAVSPQCVLPEIPRDPVDLEHKKFALSMFHFNIQYVAGGLEATLPDGKKVTLCGELCAGWDEERIHDWYIRSVFEPTLDLYLKHETWKADFEMQAYMIEWIAKRQPDVLEKLRAGAYGGRIELVSFHYSDQLFLAFPRYDLARSVEMTRGVFEEACLPLSPVVFNQEGQSGEGKHRFMAENGWTIDIFPVNLFRYYHYQEDRPYFYRSRGVDVLVGPVAGYSTQGGLTTHEEPDSGLQVTWTFFDDGDLLAYPLSPYAAPLSTEQDIAKEIANYEKELVALEQDGFKISHVSDFVAHLKAHDVPQPDLPPVLDGTWQPIDTQSVWRWLGGRGILAGAVHERDNEMRTANYRARTLLEAADILAETAGDQGVDLGEAASRLAAGWRDLALAQVTDATGIHPWQGELLYGLAHNEAAEKAAEDVLDDLLSKLAWPHASIDLAGDVAVSLEALPEDPGLPPAAPPFEVTAEAPTRTVKIEWFQVQENELFKLRLTFGPAADPAATAVETCAVAVAFPRFEERLAYTPALLEDEVVEYDFSEFRFQAEEGYLPLANGLIGLGDDWWAIKDCRTVHVAARFPTTGEAVIQFIDQTAEPAKGGTWDFLVFHGDKEAALDLASRTNISPVVVW